MTDCDNFEIAIEMRRHGQLESAPALKLDQHLATCLSCRSFATQVESTEDTMRAYANNTLEQVDWNRIQNRAMRWQRKLRIEPWLGAASLLVFLPLVLFALGGAALLPTIVGGLAVALYSWQSNRKTIKHVREANDNRELLFFLMRCELDDRIKTIKRDVVYSPVLCLLALVFFRDGMATPARIVGASLFVGFFVIITARNHFVVLPRLQRERAELG